MRCLGVEFFPLFSSSLYIHYTSSSNVAIHDYEFRTAIHDYEFGALWTLNPVSQVNPILKPNHFKRKKLQIFNFSACQGISILVPRK